MHLLLRRDRLGGVIQGSDELLIDRATRGDDITLYEESSIFTCHIVFPNYVVTGDRVSGLSLPHLAFGDLSDPCRLHREPIDIIHYIYDSKCKNLLCRDVLDQDRTATELFANNPHYARFTWYSTRRYSSSEPNHLDCVKTLGDQIKIRLTLAEDFKIIARPDIIYFPQASSGFVVKSSAMILPTAFVTDPEQYVQTGRPVIANTSFSLAYLNLDSDGMLTIVHKERFTLRESLERTLARSLSVSEPTPRFLGHQLRQADSPAGATRVHCEYTVLIPQDRKYGALDAKGN